MNAAPEFRTIRRPPPGVTLPTPGIKFLRVFLPFQIFRFFMINLKIIKMLARVHSKH